MSLSWVQQTGGTVPGGGAAGPLLSAGGTTLWNASGAIYRSTDGGVTWAGISSGITSQQIFANLGRGEWFTADNSSNLLQSLDDGLTWTPIAISGLPGSYLLTSLAAGAGIVVAVFSAGSFSSAYVSISTDGGTTWGAAVQITSPGIHHAVIGTGGFDSLSGQFYFSGWDTSFGWNIFTSPDGVTWTANLVESIFTNQPTTYGYGFANPPGSGKFIAGLQNASSIRVSSTLLGIASVSDQVIAPPLTGMSINTVSGDAIGTLLVATDGNTATGSASSLDGGATWAADSFTPPFTNGDYFIAVAYDGVHGTFIGSVSGGAAQLWTAAYSAAPTVPNVVGLDQATAEADIITAGFIVGGVSTSTDPTVPVGDVISQNPAAGSSGTLGDPVDIVVSLGPPEGVPNLIGLTQSAAVAAIIAADLSVGVVSSAINPTPAGFVFTQNPIAGSTVPAGTPVSFTISLGPQTGVVVPDIVGLTAAAAEAALADVGLMPGAITGVTSDAVPIGDVATQSPVAGSLVANGSLVDIGIAFVSPAFNIDATVISQYANSPTILALVEDFGQWFDPSQNIQNFYLTVWNIDTAIGFGLDIWGVILGVSRVLPIPGSSGAFGFDNIDVPPDFENFGNVNDSTVGGPFFSGQISGNSYRLDDNPYRVLLLTKALANICATTAPALNALITNLFPGRGVCYTVDRGNMAMSYIFTFPLSSIEFAILSFSGVLPHPAGVLVDVLVIRSGFFGFEEAGGNVAPFDFGTFFNGG